MLEFNCLFYLNHSAILIEEFVFRCSRKKTTRAAVMPNNKITEGR